MNPADARARLIAERARLTEVRESARHLHAAVANADGDALELDGLPAEKATETLEREMDESVALQAAAELDEIQAALARLDDGTYGRCLECGNPIADERLEFLPATRYCVEDQARMEKSRR